jgi:hypothetical protein
MTEETLENGHRVVGSPISDEQRAEVEAKKEEAIANEIKQPDAVSPNTAETVAPETPVLEETVAPETADEEITQ